MPCLRCLTKAEIDDAYERNTGLLIVGEFAPQELQDKHYLRKHGKNAYYGQG